VKIQLLIDQVYLPSLGGGNKACRMLLEGLAASGHECAAVARAITTRAGPVTEAQFLDQMAGRGVEVRTTGAHRFRYETAGVTVDAHNLPRGEAREAVAAWVRDFEPDWVLVSDDRDSVLVDAALEAAPERVVYIAQTIVHLPFGPLAHTSDAAQTERLRRARARVVISRSLGEYLERHAGLDSTQILPPVFGRGPFPVLSSYDQGYVTLINPCVEKGLDLFLALARRLDSVSFAAVPTWGADASVLDALEAADNVTVLQPKDDIRDILSQTRILLAPSMWPETLGYVAIEAMLHGIPVLASDIGGLKEAMLGMDYLLPVRPAERVDGSFVSGEQDLEPWLAALNALLHERATYDRVARASREAAHDYVAPISADAFARFLSDLQSLAAPA